MMPALLALAILGCNRPAPATAEQARPDAQASAPAPTAAQDVSIEANSDGLDFAFAWPAEAAAIPALDDRFRADVAKIKGEALTNAREDARMAKADGREFHGHEFSRSWTGPSDGGTPFRG